MSLSKFRLYWESMAENYSEESSYLIRAMTSTLIMFLFNMVPYIWLVDKNSPHQLVLTALLCIFTIAESMFMYSTMKVKCTRYDEFYCGYFVVVSILVMVISVGDAALHNNELDNEKSRAEYAAAKKKIESITPEVIDHVDISFIHSNSVLSVIKDPINPLEFRLDTTVCPDDRSYSLQTGRARFDNIEDHGTYASFKNGGFIWTIREVRPNIIIGDITAIERDGTDTRSCVYKLSLTPYDIKSIISYGGRVKLIGEN